MGRRWEAIVFDLDGLLIDSEPIFHEAARRLLAIRGIEFDPKFMHSIMGMPGRDVLPRFKERFGLSETVIELADEYRRTYIAAMNKGSIPMRPGATDLVSRLHQESFPIALATSSSRKYVDAVFGPHGHLPKFTHVLTCDDVSCGKPSPDIYLLTAERFNTLPSQLLVFEDSPAGVQAAKAAGCFCVAVPQAATSRESVALADLIVESLESPDLIDILAIG